MLNVTIGSESFGNHLKFFTRNSLTTIQEIAKWGSQDIKSILHLFPNHHDDEDFIHSIVMIHILTEFFKIKGEQAKSKASPLLTPISSSWLDYLPVTKDDTDKFISTIKTEDLRRLIRRTQRKFIVELQQAMEEFHDGSTITSSRSRGDPKPQTAPTSHPPQIAPTSHPPQIAPKSHPPQIAPTSHPPQIALTSHPPQITPTIHPPKVQLTPRKANTEEATKATKTRKTTKLQPCLQLKR